MKIQFPNNSPVIQRHWMIPRAETRHSFTLQTCKQTNVTDDKQPFSSSVAFCHIIIVVSQCQDGSRAAAGSEPTHTYTGIIYYRAGVFSRAPAVYRLLVFELRAEVGERGG